MMKQRTLLNDPSGTGVAVTILLAYVEMFAFQEERPFPQLTMRISKQADGRREGRKSSRWERRETRKGVREAVESLIYDVGRPLGGLHESRSDAQNQIEWRSACKGSERLTVPC